MARGGEQQEAIEILKEMIHDTVPKSAVTAQKENHVFNIAISALKQQIPQKPRMEKEPFPRHMNGCDAPFCPVCGEDLLDRHNDCFNFCPLCGQAIDWDADNEKDG